MNPPSESPAPGLPLFEPDPSMTYTIEAVARLTGVSSQTILHYQEQGLIAPAEGGAAGAGQSEFDVETLRTLRLIEHLRATCGLNESGLRLMLELMGEVERLRAALRSRR